MAVVLSLTACAPIEGSFRKPHDARLQGEALATACTGRDGWSDAAPPARIHGNTYYVGTCGITVLLVTSPNGHVLIDGATDQAVPSILANIRTLGFDPRDIRYIVGSHEHVDHMGGFAALKAATGAKLLVSAVAWPAVSTGRTDDDDPQAGLIANTQPVPVDEIITFSQEANMAVTAKPARMLMLTPHMTPGHTSGGTSWTWQSCEGKRCVNIAYVDSLSAVSADGYRFIDHPERVAPFRTTFDRVAALPCDILVTPHPAASNLFERLRGAEALVTADGCRNLATSMRRRLDDRLAKERAQ